MSKKIDGDELVISLRSLACGELERVGGFRENYHNEKVMLLSRGETSGYMRACREIEFIITQLMEDTDERNG